MNTKNIIFIVIAFAVVGGIAGIFLLGRGPSAPSSLADGERPAPDLTFRDYEGKEVALSDFRGRPMVVNSWAAWCPFCVDELVDFTRLQEEFGDKITVVAIDRAEPLATARGFSDKAGVTGKIVLLLDPADSFYSSIGGFSMPETIFVDENGLIKDHKRGPMTLEEMRRRTSQAFDL